MLANEASAQWEQVRSKVSSSMSRLKENLGTVTGSVVERFPQLAVAPPPAAAAPVRNPWSAWGMGEGSSEGGGGSSSAASRSSGGIDLDEYLMAKRALIDLSRSSMLYARPEVASIEGMASIKDEGLQKVLIELNGELDQYSEQLGLDPAEQLRELTAAITAQKQADVVCKTKAELLSRLLEVVWNAIVKLDEDVAPTRFVGAREALHALRASLREVYMTECIQY